MSRFHLILTLSIFALALACSDDTTSTPDTGNTTKDSGGADMAAKTEAGADKAVPDQAATNDAASGCDFKALSAEAEAKGTKILNGVNTKTATPIADIKANTAGYKGKLLRIEGIVTAVCQSQGCYMTVRDQKGNKLNIKLTDGKVDFRNYAKVGNYAIGEGTFDPSGEHGAQVFIDKYGALIGPTICTK